MKRLLLIFGVLVPALIAQAQKDTALANTLKQARELYKARQFGPSMQKYLKVLQLAEAKDDYIMTAHAALNAGNCRYYINQSNRPAIIQWWYRALNIAAKHGVDSVMAKAANNIAMLYTEANKVDSAEKYSQIAINHFMRIKDYGKVSIAHSFAAIRSLKLKQFTKADSLLTKAEYYAALGKDNSHMGYAALNRSDWYAHKNNYKQAIRYIDTAEKHYRTATDWDGLRYAYSKKITYLAKLGDTATARYALLWYKMTDSMLRVENAAKTAEYETLYKTEKKEKENQLLQQQNQLKQLQLEANARNLFVLIVVFLLFVAVVLWWLNRNNLKKKQRELNLLKEMQSEKERIARDLHDNVGGQLSYVIYSLDGINNEDEETRTEVTESINQSVRSVIGSLRETIWAISDANIKISDFSDRLKVFAKSLFKHTSTKVVFNEHLEKERELNALLGLNLYRICQEILNNAFKHAKARQIIIEIKSDEKCFELSISDNGIGFNLNKQENKVGYGLSNINKRAEEFGIALTLNTQQGKGTNYSLVV